MIKIEDNRCIATVYNQSEYRATVNITPDKPIVTHCAWTKCFKRANKAGAVFLLYVTVT